MGSGSSSAKGRRGQSPGQRSRVSAPWGDPQPRGGAPPAAPDSDSDGELDKALAEVRAVCEPQPQRRQRRERAEPRNPSPTPIPCLRLQGTPALRHPGAPGSLPDTALLRRNTQDVENNNIHNKFHTRSDMIAESHGPIMYDVSEEELMASIELEY